MKNLKIILLIIFLAQISFAKNIIFLSSYHLDLPWVKSVVGGVNSAKKDVKFNLYIEVLDGIRVSKNIDDKFWIEYLKTKYKDIKIDAIIAESNLASNFIARNSDIFGNIPIVVSNVSNKNLSKNIKSFSFEYDTSVKESIKIAFAQNRNLKNIYVIDSDFKEGQKISKLIIDNLKAYPYLYINIIKDYSFDELYQKVKNIEKDSVIFYPPVAKDKKAHKIVPKKLLIKLAKISNVPIYTFYSSLLGSGVVGGYVIDGDTIGKDMVKAIFDYIYDGKYNDRYNTLSTKIDYQASKKYNLDVSMFSEDELINKKISIIDSHIKEVMIALAIFGILSICIVLLIVLNRKLKISKEKLEIETQDRVKKEALLIQQSKMASIGEMVGIISHQFKQPLNSISMVASSIEDDYYHNKIDGVSLKSQIKHIDSSVKFMNQTINDFRLFFNSSKVKDEFLLFQCVDEVVSLVSPVLKQNSIKVYIDIEKYIKIDGYKNELKQVFLNLINNSYEQLVFGNIEDKEIRVSAVVDNGVCQIYFGDNGGIVDEKVIENIFDSHISTKENNNSIGMYISKLIIDNIDGELSVRNSELGVEFSIKIPIE
jgi:signal transduction histidine kinase